MQKNNIDTINDLFEEKKEYLGKSLRKYIYIMKCINENCFDDKEFRKNYSGFYRLRKNKNFKDKYFELMKNIKNENGELNIDKNKKVELLKSVLCSLYDAANNYKVELSYASKLLHSIYPGCFPIWDYNVSTYHFGIKRKYGKKNKEEKISDAIKNYMSFDENFNTYLNSKDGEHIINKLKNQDITDIKKIDFILWLDFDKNNKTKDPKIDVKKVI